MRNIRSMLVTGAAMAAAAVGGGAIASAATSNSSTTSSASNSGSAPAAVPSNFPAHGTVAHEDAEKPVTGTAAEKAKTAAVKYLGGGTANSVTTDYTGNGYEVDVTKKGTTTEVHLDSSFNVRGGPGGMHRGPSGARPQSGPRRIACAAAHAAAPHSHTNRARAGSYLLLVSRCIQSSRAV